MSWDQQFFDPIELPKGKKLVTLRDAAARIGVMRALNRHVEREFNPSKDTHWGRRKLARERGSQSSVGRP